MVMRYCAHIRCNEMIAEIRTKNSVWNEPTTWIEYDLRWCVECILGDAINGHERQ